MWPPGMFDRVEKYTGFDVVQSVVERNRALMGSSRFEFHLADATRAGLPEADLLLCKEVLQHLPNSTVHRFLETTVSAYPLVVVCDDIWIGSSSAWRRAARNLLGLVSAPRVGVNQDIEPGGYRPLDYSLAPFSSLGLKKVLVYQSFAPPRCRTIKAVWSSSKS